MRKNKYTFYIFSHNVEPNGISGGETILIETFKRISRYFKSIKIYAWKPSKELYIRYGLTNVIYKLSNIPVIPNFYISFVLRTIYGFWLGIKISIKDPKNSYLYFSSDFWPDALPVMLLKLRYPEATFVSNFYLSAPNPFIGFKEKGGFRFPTINGLFFYFMQKPVYYFSKKFADIVFVTSSPDVDKFPKQKAQNKYFVVKGGVNVREINEYTRKHQYKKKYDAVFMGRFHPQKGVLELIDIWKYVSLRKKSAKLIMIGDGPLMSDVIAKIKALKLEKNIILKGYVFKQEDRYSIFQSSRVALHPAIYDSGGMAVAEAMAFGLPAVSFNLLALKSYYPKGMIKVPLGNKEKFAKEVITLLEKKKIYDKVAHDAVELVREEWDWDKRAKLIAKKLLSLKNYV